jgi:hypothetical protein
MKKSNWVKICKDTGEIFDMIGTYECPEDHYINPPQMLNEQEQQDILSIMVKNGIKRLEVIN